MKLEQPKEKQLEFALYMVKDNDDKKLNDIMVYCISVDPSGPTTREFVEGLCKLLGFEDECCKKLVEWIMDDKDGHVAANAEVLGWLLYEMVFDKNSCAMCTHNPLKGRHETNNNNLV